MFQADPGSGVAPGQSQNLAVVLGPVPDVGHVLLPAVQTYDDGTVAEWTATPEQVADDDTLEPAPVLYVTDTPPGDEHAGHDTATAEEAAATVTTESGSDTSGTGVAIGLSIAALIVAAGAAILAAVSLASRRKARG